MRSKDRWLCCGNSGVPGVPRSLRYIYGQVKKAEYPDGPRPSVHLIWTPVPASLTLPPGQLQARWGFLLAAAPAAGTAEAAFDEGLRQMAAGNLRPSHEKAWAELWLLSTVEAVGLGALSRALIGCLFYLLSAFPSIHDASAPFGGVSPGGLSNGRDGQDYWGHVFWDLVKWGGGCFYRWKLRNQHGGESRDRKVCENEFLGVIVTSRYKLR